MCIEKVRERNIIDRLKEKKILLTKHRQLVIQTICSYNEINDLSAIYIGLRASHTISSGSVYLCIRLLIDLNILVKSLDGKNVVYHFNPDFEFSD